MTESVRRSSRAFADSCESNRVGVHSARLQPSLSTAQLKLRTTEPSLSTAQLKLRTTEPSLPTAQLKLRTTDVRVVGVRAGT